MSALTDTFSAIANAIRGKLGVQTTYTPTQMSSAIASIPTAKEEQTKSVTATTSQQTVTPDSGKVLSSVTVNPQVHSATYTPTGYSNANDMGAQNNYRYVDTSAYEPTSITPSNSSPATITSGETYTATASGCAIESYKTISNLPQNVTNGDMLQVRADGSVAMLQALTPSNTSPPSIGRVAGNIFTESGYAIRSYTPVTPSSTPTSISAGDMMQVNGSGVIVDSVPTPTNITPSNNSPVSLSSGGIYKPSSSGYAISSYSSKTPSDTSPASVSSGAIIKASSAGYLYATQQTKSITLLGSITIADTSNHTVTFSQSIKGFRYIMVCMGSSVATNKYYANDTGGGCGSVIIFDSDKWVSGFTLDGGYTTGSSGSQSTRTDTITYSSNTAMIIKHSNSTSRTDYIYGLN